MNNIRFKIIAGNNIREAHSLFGNNIPEFYTIFARKMPDYIIRQRYRGQAEAKSLRLRLNFGLVDLASQQLILFFVHILQGHE